MTASKKLYSIPQYDYTTYTAEDGLSLNIVTQVIQDSRGFLWLGTYNGLNRYDGYNFKVYLPDPKNPTSISNHSIWALYEDSKGYLWVGTLNGLNKYDRKKDRFEVYRHNPQDPYSLSNSYVYSIREDKSGNLWIGTANGLNKYNRDKNNFTVYKQVSDSLNLNSLNSVLAMEEDHSENLWLGTWKGLTCIRKDGAMTYLSLPVQKNDKALAFNNICVLREDKDRNLWIGTRTGLFRYNPFKGQFHCYMHESGNPYSISDNYINTIYIDKQNNIWIGTRAGLNKYDFKRDCFDRLYQDGKNSLITGSGGVLCITQDQTGLIWLGTSAGTIKFFEPVNHFSFFSGNNSIDLNTRIFSTFIDKKEDIWIGTSKGLYKINHLTNFVTDYSHIGLPDDHVTSIYEDHSGKFWIGTDAGGLVVFDPGTYKIRIFKYNSSTTESLSNNGILSIAEDDSGYIWVGTWWGINKINRKTEKIIRYIDKFNNNATWVIQKSSEGLLWFGTDGGGLGQYNPKKGIFTNYLSRTDGNSIAGNRVISIFESRDKIMWFGTTEGLTCYNPLTKKFSTYNKSNGLPSILINSIQEDNKGQIWIATDKGLSRLDIKTSRFINFGERDGLKYIEYAPNSSAITKQGEILFGSVKGLLKFNPAKITDGHSNAPLVITDIKIYNQSLPITADGILHESISYAKSISVPSGNDMITLDFALLDFSDVKRNTFQYKLDGFDQDWNKVGVRNSATYTNLPPGEYTFFLRAKIDNGLLNEKEVALKLIIEPAFHQTIWFRFLITAGLVISVIMIFQVRIRAVRRLNKILENKVAERTKDLDRTINELNSEIASKNKFFSIIAHDLRSPFSALLGLSKYLVDEVDHISTNELRYVSENIHTSTEHTFGLLENLLHWAKVETGRIDLDYREVNLKKTVEPLIDLYRGNAANKKIHLYSEIDENISVVADINTLETIVRNLISNAIKFSNKNGKVLISACDMGDYVKITVKDTGIGIDSDILGKLFQVSYNISTLGTQNEKGSGLGLILCKEFVELNKGELAVQSIPGNGSEFSFTLPKIHQN